tara:strand:- start:201 stop:416 length:216 start_codon:yes stop_codon:yes gene_type:complete
MNSEEKVFTIVELRLNILKFLINPFICINCGYIPKEKIQIKKNQVYICEWCDPYACEWNPHSLSRTIKKFI